MDKKVISWEDFNGHVAELARQIANSDWRPDYIVGLTRGGLIPATMLSHYFDIPMYALSVSLRDDSGMGPESNLWMAEDAFGYVDKNERDQEHIPYDVSKAKNILIVDDINDSGATLDWIMDDWASGCMSSSDRWDYVWNQNVKFAVVVDNLSSKCSVCMDFVGTTVNKAEKDVWVEFPYEAWWRP